MAFLGSAASGRRKNWTGIVEEWKSGVRGNTCSPTGKFTLMRQFSGQGDSTPHKRTTVLCIGATGSLLLELLSFTIRVEFFFSLQEMEICEYLFCSVLPFEG